MGPNDLTIDAKSVEEEEEAEKEAALGSFASSHFEICCDFNESSLTAPSVPSLSLFNATTAACDTNQIERTSQLNKVSDKSELTHLQPQLSLPE